MAKYAWMVRSTLPEDQFDPNYVYSEEKEVFTIAVHHGGEFTIGVDRRYEAGTISMVDFCCIHDGFDSVLLEEMVRACGGYSLDMVFYYHYQLPSMSLDNGLRYLENKDDFKDMFDLVREGHREIHVYVEHWNTLIHTGYSSFEKDYSTDEEIPSSQHKDDDSESIEAEGDCKDLEYDDENEEEDCEYMVDDCFIDEDAEKDIVEYKLNVVSEDIPFCENPVDGYDEGIDPIDLDDFESGSDSDNPSTALKRAMKQVRRQEKMASSNIDSCPFYVGQKLDDKETIKKMVKDYAIRTRRELFFAKNDKVRVRVVCIGSSLEPNKVDGQLGKSTRKLKTGPKGSGDVSVDIKGKGVKVKNPKKKPPTPTCDWVLHCSRSDESEPFVVKTLKDTHKCLKSRELGLYTMGYIAKEIVPILETNPEIPLYSLQDQLQKNYQMNVSIQKVFRAKMIAQKKLIGDYKEQYAFLRDYAEEILRTNPGSTVRIDVEPGSHPSCTTRQFRRIYICYSALKEGFKVIGRDLIGLDGAFMKGPYPGQILSAVGMDCNNGIFPVAFALVEAETYQSWLWFLELLGEDLTWDASSKVTFISDRQKGLIPALAKVFPLAEHRYCLRHVHENMKKQWNGTAYKNLLWKAASATHKPKFVRAMEEIKGTNENLHKWLSEIPAVHWSRSHFSGRAQTDVLLNNICEVFNRQLVGARDKPVYTCLEFIRTYLQKRIVNVKKMIARCDGPLTPAATKMFVKIKEDAAQYNVLMCGRGKYQVNGPWADQVVVDMDQKSCSCRRWDITGMPCRHVVAVIWDIARNNLGSGIPENYVARVYWLDTWKLAYQENINPIPGKEHWLPSGCPTTLTPPKHHTPVGRPKKSRRKSADEVQRSFNHEGKITRMGATTTCNKCGKQGHNSRSCKGQEQKIDKKKKKRADSGGRKKFKRESHQIGSSQGISQGAPTATPE